MIKSYLIVAWRNIRKQKVFSVINLLGMAVGIAGFSLFAHMGGVKLNADRFHENAAHIYTVVQELTAENGQEVHTTFVPSPLAQTLSSEFPEIKETTRVLTGKQMALRYQGQSFL